MSQFPHPCSRCGTSIPANQRFCLNCGAPAEASNPAGSFPGGGYAPPSGAYAPTQQAAPPGGYPQQGAQNFQQAPSYAQPQKKKRGVLGGVGCVGGLLILLVLVVCGASGYFGWKWVTSRAASTDTNTGTGTQANGVQPPITTTLINATVPYSSVMVTVVNAQQATSFADDTSTAAPGVVRLNLSERQAVPLDTAKGSTSSGFYDYQGFTLLLPGGTSVASVNSQKTSGPPGSATQANWLDFPVPTSIKVSQLTLRIGTATEAQMNVPLTGHADLSKYQSRLTHPNVRGQYAGMTWTLTSVSAQLSAGGKQADKSMQYIVVEVSVNNPTAQNVPAYSPDYVRLQ
ncbi:MAG: zinc ribbon domain-containing protein, partial [Chloroflexota bacterium]|nr:zinc ribbon domain-containing protein [Chloroflexota bacterium]